MPATSAQQLFDALMKDMDTVRKDRAFVAQARCLGYVAGRAMHVLSTQRYYARDHGQRANIPFLATPGASFTPKLPVKKVKP